MINLSNFMRLLKTFLFINIIVFSLKVVRESVHNTTNTRIFSKIYCLPIKTC